MQHIYSAWGDYLSCSMRYICESSIVSDRAMGLCQLTEKHLKWKDLKDCAFFFQSGQYKNNAVLMFYIGFKKTAGEIKAQWK